MEHYQSLFQIKVTHTYFVEKLLKNLTFEPSIKTLAILRNAHLHMKLGLGGVHLFFNTDRMDVLKSMALNADEPLILAFKVHVQEPYFLNYTTPSFSKQNAILFFNNANKAIRDTYTLQLHKKQFVSSSDFISLNSEDLQSLLSLHEWKTKTNSFLSSFLVGIYLTKEDLDKIELHPERSGVLYEIHYQARKTYWTYYLLRHFSQPNMSIVDLDQKVSFQAQGTSSLPGGRKALVFRSNQPIALQEKSSCRFQLREEKESGHKVLIKRLPVAAVDSIYQEVVDQDRISLSEIYIN